jgi:O2-independent ubiquinone biosynthesis accessory factor UbiT
MLIPLHYPPQLPWPLAAPLSLVPGIVHSTALTAVLNRVFGALAAAGELDFLRDRVLCIQVRDARTEYRLSLTARGFVPCRAGREPDLVIGGTLYDFVTLATRHEDSDTLFFNRRLVLEGDTALGLQLKNLLDGMEVPASVAPALQALGKLVALYERNARRD